MFIRVKALLFPMKRQKLNHLSIKLEGTERTTAIEVENAEFKVKLAALHAQKPKHQKSTNKAAP
jgi:hypothetical protein